MDSEIEEGVKGKFMEEFSQLTPKGGRKLLRDLGVLISPKWDIANAMIFDSIRKEKDTQLKLKKKSYKHIED